MAIKPQQIVPYDNAAQQIARAADLLDEINVANIDRDDVAEIYELTKRARELRAQLFHKAHAAFIAARFGEAT